MPATPSSDTLLSRTGSDIPRFPTLHLSGQECFIPALVPVERQKRNVDPVPSQETNHALGYGVGTEADQDYSYRLQLIQFFALVSFVVPDFKILNLFNTVVPRAISYMIRQLYFI